MSRRWNVTGLYKAQRDRVPVRRSRRLPVSPTTKLVPIPPAPTCADCGFGIDTNAHRIYCVEAPGTKPAPL